MPSLATHQVEYTAATFSPAVGCNPGDYWNADTLRRYLAILNDYGAKGWRLLDMDVIPFESGCWPFKQKGALYLMTFERTA